MYYDCLTRPWKPFGLKTLLHFRVAAKMAVTQDPRKVFVGNVPVGIDRKALADVLGNG